MEKTEVMVAEVRLMKDGDLSEEVTTHNLITSASHYTLNFNSTTFFLAVFLQHATPDWKQASPLQLAKQVSVHAVIYADLCFKQHFRF